MQDANPIVREEAADGAERAGKNRTGDSGNVLRYNPHTRRDTTLTRASDARLYAPWKTEPIDRRKQANADGQSDATGKCRLSNLTSNFSSDTRQVSFHYC
jgi:hypothetical protein